MGSEQEQLKPVWTPETEKRLDAINSEEIQTLISDLFDAIDTAQIYLYIEKKEFFENLSNSDRYNEEQLRAIEEDVKKSNIEMMKESQKYWKHINDRLEKMKEILESESVESGEDKNQQLNDLKIIIAGALKSLDDFYQKQEKMIENSKKSWGAEKEESREESGIDQKRSASTLPFARTERVKAVLLQDFRRNPDKYWRPEFDGMNEEEIFSNIWAAEQAINVRDDKGKLVDAHLITASEIARHLAGGDTGGDGRKRAAEKFKREFEKLVGDLIEKKKGEKAAEDPEPEPEAGAAKEGALLGKATDEKKAESESRFPTLKEFAIRHPMGHMLFDQEANIKDEDRSWIQILEYQPETGMAIIINESSKFKDGEYGTSKITLPELEELRKKHKDYGEKIMEDRQKDPETKKKDDEMIESLEKEFGPPGTEYVIWENAFDGGGQFETMVIGRCFYYYYEEKYKSQHKEDGYYSFPVFKDQNYSETVYNITPEGIRKDWIGRGAVRMDAAERLAGERGVKLLSQEEFADQYGEYLGDGKELPGKHIFQVVDYNEAAGVAAIKESFDNEAGSARAETVVLSDLNQRIAAFTSKAEEKAPRREVIADLARSVRASLNFEESHLGIGTEIKTKKELEIAISDLAVTTGRYNNKFENLKVTDAEIELAKLEVVKLFEEERNLLEELTPEMKAERVKKIIRLLVRTNISQYYYVLEKAKDDKVNKEEIDDFLTKSGYYWSSVPEWARIGITAEDIDIIQARVKELVVKELEKRAASRARVQEIAAKVETTGRAEPSDGLITPGLAGEAPVADEAAEQAPISPAEVFAKRDEIIRRDLEEMNVDKMASSKFLLLPDEEQTGVRLEEIINEALDFYRVNGAERRKFLVEKTTAYIVETLRHRNSRAPIVNEAEAGESAAAELPNSEASQKTPPTGSEVLEPAREPEEETLESEVAPASEGEPDAPVLRTAEGIRKERGEAVALEKELFDKIDGSPESEVFNIEAQIRAQTARIRKLDKELREAEEREESKEKEEELIGLDEIVREADEISAELEEARKQESELAIKEENLSKSLNNIKAERVALLEEINLLKKSRKKKEKKEIPGKEKNIREIDRQIKELEAELADYQLQLQETRERIKLLENELKEAGETDARIEEEKKIEEEIKGMKPEKLRKVGRAILNLGFHVEEKTDNFFAKSLKGLAKKLSKGKEDKKIISENKMVRFLYAMGESYSKNANSARGKMETLDELRKNRKGKGLKGRGRFFAGKESNLLSVSNAGYVSSNVIKTARVVGDVAGYTALMPLRYVMMGGMFFAQGAEAIKEAELNSEKAMDKTRIHDIDFAMDEAWNIYNKAKAGKNEVTLEDLKKAYQKEMPKDILDRLESEPLAENSSGLVMRGVQRLMHWDLQRSAEKIIRQLDKVEQQKDISPEEKELRKEAILSRYSSHLEDLDRMVSQYGTVDALAMGMRYLSTAGRAVTGGVALETAGFTAMKLWENLPRYFHEFDKFIRPSSPEGKPFIKRHIYAPKTVKPAAPTEPAARLRPESPEASSQRPEQPITPSAVTQEPVTHVSSEPQSASGRVEPLPTPEKRGLKENFALNLGKGKTPVELERTFQMMAVDHMKNVLGQDNIFGDEEGAKSLNIAANLVRLAEGKGTAGIKPEDLKEILSWNPKTHELKIINHEKFNALAGRLEAHADELWKEGKLEKGAGKYLGNIKKGIWEKIVKAEGLEEKVAGHDEIKPEQIKDFGHEKAHGAGMRGDGRHLSARERAMGIKETDIAAGRAGIEHPSGRGKTGAHVLEQAGKAGKPGDIEELIRKPQWPEGKGARKIEVDFDNKYGLRLRIIDQNGDGDADVAQVINRDGEIMEIYRDEKGLVRAGDQNVGNFANQVKYEFDKSVEMKETVIDDAIKEIVKAGKSDVDPAAFTPDTLYRAGINIWDGFSKAEGLRLKVWIDNKDIFPVSKPGLIRNYCELAEKSGVSFGETATLKAYREMPEDIFRAEGKAGAYLKVFAGKFSDGQVKKGVADLLGLDRLPEKVAPSVDGTLLVDHKGARIVLGPKSIDVRHPSGWILDKSELEGRLGEKGPYKLNPTNIDEVMKWTNEKIKVMGGSPQDANRGNINKPVIAEGQSGTRSIFRKAPVAAKTVPENPAPRPSTPSISSRAPEPRVW
ncbi:MAG: hypothetical protein WCW25_03975 [Patescibacteria group bacterium]|jgi:hypothetical protein